MASGVWAMSSALWLPPPPASVLNALLAQKGVSPALSGRYRKVPRKICGGSRGRSPSRRKVEGWEVEGFLFLVGREGERPREPIQAI